MNPHARLFPLLALVAFALCRCDSMSEPGLDDEVYMELDAGKYDRARTLLEPMLANDPHNAFLELDLGIADQNLGERDAAARLYRAVLADGKGVKPEWTVNPQDDGLTLDAIACRNLKDMNKNEEPCPTSTPSRSQS